MKFCVTFGVLLATLIGSVAASSQFSSSYVADLGKDFDEKVSVTPGEHELAAANHLIA